MDIRHVIVTHQALNDLDQIWDYLATKASPDIARKVIDKILDATERLTEMPGLGHRRNDLSKRYRAWNVFRFLIIYRFNARSLYVERVVHGPRDVKRTVGR
jgi:toxin ParE1/3/4